MQYIYALYIYIYIYRHASYKIEYIQNINYIKIMNQTLSSFLQANHHDQDKDS